MNPFSDLDLETQKDFAAAFARRFSTSQQKHELFLQAELNVPVHDAPDDIKLWLEVFSLAQKRERTEPLIEAAISLRPEDEILLAISEVLTPKPEFNLFGSSLLPLSKSSLSRSQQYVAVAAAILSIIVVGSFFAGEDSISSSSETRAQLSDGNAQHNLVSIEKTHQRIKRSNSRISERAVEKSETLVVATHTTQDPPEAKEKSPTEVAELLAATHTEPASFHDPIAAALAQATDRLLEQERLPSEDTKAEIAQQPSNKGEEKTTLTLASTEASLKNNIAAAVQQKSPEAPQASTTEQNIIFKKCNYSSGEQLYGYWWGGDNLLVKKGNTIIIGEWSHVREEYPAKQNRFNSKSTSKCVLRPGEKVVLKEDPVMVNGHAWIAIYADAIKE